MNQVTRIRIYKGLVTLLHSTKIVDKKDSYTIFFDSYYIGFFKIVRKESVSKAKILSPPLETIIFVSTSRFQKNQDYWINLAIEDYRNRFSKYRWYIEPYLKTL